MDDVEAELLRKLEKENLLLKRKLERAELHLADAEQHMDQTLVLLKRVTDERLTEEERRRLEVFRKFVPADFLVSLGKERFEDIQLGDFVERDMTILFSDIRKFTSISESLTPKGTFDFLNEYLHQVEPAIAENGGFIDKFIGDAIMALFYTPDDAIQAGIDMRRALEEFNKSTARQNLAPINIGIGIHSGPCMMGIIGGQDRMEGTVVSDAVNLAARLESLTKHYMSALLVSETTLNATQKSNVYLTRFLGKIIVVGKVHPVSLFEILDAEPGDIRDLKQESKTFLEEGIGLFIDRQFDAAKEKFMGVLKIFPEDAVAKLYLDEAVAFEKHKPKDDWMGTITMLEK